jgi:hypothetical protein
VKKRLTIMLLLAVMAAAATNAQTVRYVKAGGTGNGTSWAAASGDLQEMINQSAAGNQVWVASGACIPARTASGYNASNGTYPTADGARDNAFVLKAGVKIYGGFNAASPETSVAARQTVTVNGIVQMQYQSILSGDRGAAGDNSDNCHHVIIGAGSMTAGADTARLDGFTVTAGNGNGSGTITVNAETINMNYGGGIYNNGSSPVLTSVTINGNTAPHGGGIFNEGSSPVLTNLVINGNTASSGGGMYNSSSSNPVLTNVTIIGNTAYLGGGIYNAISSSPVLTNVVISGNRANGFGGGIGNNTSCSPVLTNVTISGNSTGGNGGGISNSYSSNPDIRNSVIWGNTASTGNNVHNASNSTATYQYSLVQGENATGTNIGGDPLFVYPVPASAAPTIDGYYRPQYGSPLLNAGSNALNTTPHDVEGNTRIQQGTIEIGAYEIDYSLPCECE